ncbi:MAG: WYL domain-containing protein [Eggerthellaceae bacterium]|nr:WYL domain-containing protein [Eggerthellaceae bacterium]
MSGRKKPRILYVAKILHEESDPEHGISMPDLLSRLEDFGISADRKAIYRDLDDLRAAGLDIQKVPTRPVGYCIASRLLSDAQMSLLMNAVSTSRSITEESSKQLASQLSRLQSIHQAEALRSTIHVTGRPKTTNEDTLQAISLIQQALAEKRDISFSYMRYDIGKKLAKVPANDGQARVKTPLYLVYSDGNCYLLVFDERTPMSIRSYRVDRMANVMLLEASDTGHKPPAEFDIDEYVREHIGMYDARPVKVKLKVAEDVISNVIDIFGIDGAEATRAKDVQELSTKDGSDSRKWANVHVKAAPTPAFFGQISQFGGDVRIASPKRVVTAYADHLKRCMAAQELQAEQA